MRTHTCRVDREEPCLLMNMDRLSYNRGWELSYFQWVERRCRNVIFVFVHKTWGVCWYFIWEWCPFVSSSSNNPRIATAACWSLQFDVLLLTWAFSQIVVQQGWLFVSEETWYWSNGRFGWEQLFVWYSVHGLNSSGRIAVAVDTLWLEGLWIWTPDSNFAFHAFCLQALFLMVCVQSHLHTTWVKSGIWGAVRCIHSG